MWLRRVIGVWQATKINFEFGDSLVSLFSSLLSSLLGLGKMRASSVDVVALNSTGTTGRIFARKEVILSGGMLFPTTSCDVTDPGHDMQAHSELHSCLSSLVCIREIL